MATTVKASSSGSAGDPQKGAKIFKEHCAGCHNISEDMKHKYGPNLYGVWGRPASSLPDFKFKEPPQANKVKGVIWNEESLSTFLDKDKVHVPGTKMKFKFLDHGGQNKADLIAFIKDATTPSSGK